MLKGHWTSTCIHLFIYSSIDNLKIMQYQKSQLIPLLFKWCFVNRIIFRVSYRLLFGVFIEADFENKEMLEIFFSQKVGLIRR